MTKPAQTVEALNGEIALLEQEIAALRADRDRLGAELAARVSAAEAAALRYAESERARAAFFLAMAHELRTPLSAILGYAELLVDEAEEAGAADLTPDLLRIHGSGHHLMSLLDAIFDLLRIEAGEAVLVVESFEIAPVVDDVVMAARTLIESAGVALEVDCASDIGSIQADPQKIRMALFHLLSNAARALRRGELRLRVHREPATREGGAERVLFSVTAASGEPVLPQAARLFESFDPRDFSAPPREGTAGFALALSRHFVRQMGGDIRPNGAGIEMVISSGAAQSAALDVTLDSRETIAPESAERGPLRRPA